MSKYIINWLEQHFKPRPYLLENLKDSLPIILLGSVCLVLTQMFESGNEAIISLISAISFFSSVICLSMGGVDYLKRKKKGEIWLGFLGVLFLVIGFSLLLFIIISILINIIQSLI